MTTCVAVKKDGEIAIGADSLVTFGDTRLAHGYEENEKIFRVGDSYIALSGTAAHFPVLRKLLRNLGEECRFNTREEVFDTFSRVHEILKDKYFLNTKEDDDDPYESSQLTALIASPQGIFGVYSYREVFSFDRFWSTGSGRSFALGGMMVAYGQDFTAKQIAQAGLEAGVEFDRNSSAPFQIFSFPMHESAPLNTGE